MNPVNNTKGQSDVIVREFAPEQVVQGVVGPWENYCDGYSNSGSSGNSYVAVLTLSTGVFKALNVDFKLESIIAYDICESGKQSDSAYIGQINMLTASSFSGVNGLVWGLQAAKNPEIDQQQPLFMVDENGKNIPVYDAKPLLDAGKVLFGSADNRRFPIAPGAHVICANKSYTTPTGPGEPVDTWAWAAIALGICEDGETQSNCFMENYGSLVCQGSTSDDIEAFKQEEIRKMARSYAYIGQDQNVFYTKVYVGFIYTRVPAGSVGCSLVCAPYVVLPKNAIPEGNPQKLLTMNLREWDQATRKYNYSTQVQQKVTQVQQKV